MPLLRVSTSSALSALSAGGDRVKWPDGRSPDKRLAALAEVSCSPTFGIRPEDKIFTIGSCFARNIERRLQDIGFETPMYDPEMESRLAALGLTASSLNKYNAATIRSELEWACGQPMPKEDEVLLPMTNGSRHDLFLNQGATRLSLENARTARRIVAERFRRVRETRIIVITLGLAEAWFDTRSGLHINEMPPRSVLRGEPNRFMFDVMDYDEILAHLNAIHALLTCHGHPDFKILISVSPVPLRITFRNTDVMSANMYSKSVQRAAAEAFAITHSNVDYFPSYEIVSLSDRRIGYESDNRHVQAAVISRIVDDFISQYMPDVKLVPQQHRVEESVVNDLNDSSALISTANFHMREGKYAEAAECFQTLLDRFGDSQLRIAGADLHVRYGLCLLRCDDREGGLRETRLAVDMVGNDTSPLLKCADNFLLAQDAESARQALRMFDEFEQDTPDSILRHGRCSLAEGNNVEAKTVFKGLIGRTDSSDSVKVSARKWLKRLQHLD